MAPSEYQSNAKNRVAGTDFSMPAHEWGDRGDLNPRPLGPQPSALTGLSYDHHADVQSATPRRFSQHSYSSDNASRRREAAQVEWCQTVKRGVIHVSNEFYVAPKSGRQSQRNYAA